MSARMDELTNINGESWSFCGNEALDNYAAWESTLLIGGAIQSIIDPYASSMALFFDFEMANTPLWSI
jgi:hypothetical protein